MLEMEEIRYCRWKKQQRSSRASNTTSPLAQFFFLM